MEIERRAFEVRATGRKLEGYAAVFGIPATIGPFTETIRAGAFTASLAAPDSDVLFLHDHASDRVLARQRNGSLRLSQDSRGLAFEADLPNTTLGADALAMVESRLAGGMSFGFRVNDEHWSADGSKRELRAVALAEISLVSGFPAYDQTTVSARVRHLGRQSAAARIRLMRIHAI